MYVTNLSTAYAQRTLCPSSDIRLLEFATDATSLAISLSYDGRTFYKATLYSFSERVSAHSIDQVIGDFMLANGLHRASVSVYAYVPGFPNVSAYMDIDVAYCSYTLPEGHDLSAAFLSLLQTQRVHPSAVLDVYGALSSGDSVSFRISGFSADGIPDSCEMEASASDGYVAVDMSEIRAYAAAQGLGKVTMVSLFSGDAVKSFVIVEMPSFLEFRFRNCFNVLETVYVSGTSEMATDVARDMAVCNGRAMQYNQTVTRTYEHTTDPLTRLEAAALSQLVEARCCEVRVSDSEWVPVIITDHDLKVSNDDSTLNSVKFTWRFADSRPRLFGSSLSPLLESYGIFTAQFTDPYQ